MAEHHCDHHHDQKQYFSSLQSTPLGATIVNIGEVMQNHDEGCHCKSPSSSNSTTTATTSAPNSSWVHRQNHPATSPVNETVINLGGHNNTFIFNSSPEPQAADSEKNAPHRRCNCAEFLKKRWVITTLITLIVILVAVGGFVYSVKPNKLKFTIDDLSIQGFSNTANLALSHLSLSDSNYTTSCNITVKVRNSNKLFKIYHDDGSVISVHHRNTELFHGAAPSLFQKAGNETTLRISLKNENSSSSSIGLLKKMQESKDFADGMIPLDVRFGARAVFKFLSVSINVTIRADCQLIVNALAVDSEILSQHCPVTLTFGLSDQHFKP